MSYDYNALVAKIASLRSPNVNENNDDDTQQRLQQAVDTFAILSSHCPMTPLLWMQYAKDTHDLIQCLLQDPNGALEMRLQTLELGLAEFPGCAILRLHYLELLLSKQASSDSSSSYTITVAFQEALKHVGHGSHRNEGELVAAIYRLYVQHLLATGLQDMVLHVFVERARTPMKDANDSLMGEFQQICQTHNIATLSTHLQLVEDGRRWAAKTFLSLMTFEDEIDVAMHAEGILSRHQFPHDPIDWDKLLQTSSSQIWMGLGGTQTATAFSRYAQACARYKSPQSDEGDSMKEDDDESNKAKETDRIVQTLAFAVYERGIAECPTAESLWRSYVKHLMYLIKSNHPLASVERLQSAASRAVRNCPYSLPLFQQKLQVSFVLAEAGHAVFDPDVIMTVLSDATKAKFLPDPTSYLELYMTATRIVKRRILSILSKTSQTGTTQKAPPAYDEAEPIDKHTKNSVKEVLKEEDEQEVQDLIEDLRDMYDAAETFLLKNHNTWSEGRSILWKERAKTELYLLCPLMMASLLGEDETANGAAEALRCYERLVGVHQPAHPDSYASYIQCILTSAASTPRDVAQKFRIARALYQRGISTVGKKTDNDDAPIMGQRDRETALHCLCHDYLELEQLFGSEESYIHAFKLVRKKLESFVANGDKKKKKSRDIEKKTNDESHVASEVHVKRKLSEDYIEEPTTKRAKPTMAIEPVAEGTTDESPPAASDEQHVVKLEATPPKQSIPKVRIGKLEYPAHPFTVRVTNLAQETDDMDLVDTFRPKCGTVVHAKIVRDKHAQHGKGKSKGWGLVQFEERESAEKALELNDVIGIHEKLVKVERSHVPAVGLVPPGMHRVNPQGEGKSTKRNLKRKEQFPKSHPDVSTEVPRDETTVPRNAVASVLAFRPRGLARGLTIADSDKHPENK